MADDSWVRLRRILQRHAVARTICGLRWPKGLMKSLTSSAAAVAGKPPEVAATVGVVELAGGVAGAGSLPAGCCVPCGAELGAALTGPKDGPIRAAEVAGKGTGTVFTGAGAETEAGTAGVAVAAEAVDGCATPGALAVGGAPEAGGAAVAAP